MNTLKIIFAALIIIIGAEFICVTNADAWPKHRHHYRRVVIRTYRHPQPVLVWVEGHWTHNKFGKPVWRKGHWKKIYRY